MVTGRTAFSGATRASLIGAILRDDPAPDLARASALSPGRSIASSRSVSRRSPRSDGRRRATSRCRSKASGRTAPPRSRSSAAPPRRRRLSEDASAGGSPPPPSRSPSSSSPRLAGPRLRRASCGLSCSRLPGTSFEYGPNSAPRGGVSRRPPTSSSAPATRTAGYASGSATWTRRAYVCPGGEGALFPFWSPDYTSHRILREGALKLVEASPSPQPPRVLASDILEARGGSWGRGRDDSVFARQSCLR